MGLSHRSTARHLLRAGARCGTIRPRTRRACRAAVCRLDRRRTGCAAGARNAVAQRYPQPRISSQPGPLMLNAECVYMLAADHRWQWEEWCDARSIPRARISEVKQLAADGFRLARDRSSAVREFGALLLDAQYSSGGIAGALDA